MDDRPSTSRRRVCAAAAMAPPSPGRRVLAGHHGEQLAAAAEQPVDHLDPDPDQVAADDDDLAVDQPEDVALVARPGVGQRRRGWPR